MAEKKDKVLCCPTCKNPIEHTNADGTAYCYTCVMPISMKDTFLEFVYPKCDKERKFFRCPKCGKIHQE